jgi:DNA repair protein RadC
MDSLLQAIERGNAAQIINTPAMRLAQYGPAVMTDEDLITLATGKPGAASIASESCTPFARLDPHRLSIIAGKKRAEVLAAAMELGRRSVMAKTLDRARLDAPESVAAHLMPRHGGAIHEGEVFGILALDSKHRLLGEKIVATGGRHSVAITPADVFQAALPFRPRSIVAFHNHPSGDPHPSEEDKALTYRLTRAGEVLGIALVDHIVLGASSFASFRQLGLM